MTIWEFVRALFAGLGIVTALGFALLVVWAFAVAHQEKRWKRSCCALCGVPGWDGVSPRRTEHARHWSYVAKVLDDDIDYCAKCALAVTEARAIYRTLRRTA